MSRERREALVRGDGCPLCAEVHATEDRNSEGYFVADLAVSRLRLSMDQSLADYCVLICRKHVREPHELDHADRLRFFEDMTHVGEALERAYSALKINYQILGNTVPHLHCHIQPRFHGDPYPDRPVDARHPVTALSPVEYEAHIARIRTALVVS
jgi:diadenosine tetraphosphate (Ap4A) HIT family hydrolase